MKRTLIVVILAFSCCAPAMAQLPTPQQVQARIKAALPQIKTPAQVQADVETLVKQFEQVSVADLNNALKIYTAANNLNGMNCTAQWLKVAQANAAADAAVATGTPAAGTPDATLGLFSLLAKAYNIHVAFMPGSPVRSQCAAMKEDLTQVAGLLGPSAVTKLLPIFSMLGF